MVKAIIFDLFGVIRPDALPAMYEKFGGDPERDAQFIHDTIGAANRGLIPNSRSVFAERFAITPEQWQAAFDEYAGNDQRLLDFIVALRAEYKTGLLSNVSRGRLPELFGPGELEKSFDAAVASGDIGYAKPEPQAYETVADRLGVRLSECVFTDDQEDYCDGARAVGMQAILYKSFGQFKDDLSKVLSDV